VRDLRAADEVWIHCGWLPCLWWAAFWAKLAYWMPEACYDPVRLKFSAWKKKLAGPVERWALRRCEKIVATCEAEKGWIEAYLGERCSPIEVTDIKRFFDLNHVDHVEQVEGRSLHLLYLGRRHPLKGLEYLEQAVKGIEGIELRIVSNAFGEELEKVWDWCDVLVLPTLSENFGLVVAEALERGKRVITTDGAPVWNPGDRGPNLGDSGQELGVSIGYDGRLLYLRGYRDGAAEDRILLLNEAIKRICK
jgi:glycosyltransferase involved in cell wall biosynthesis